MTTLFMDGLVSAESSAASGIEGAYLALGMGAPWMRFLGTSAITAVLLFAVKPKAMFAQDGSARPWSVLMPFYAPDGPTPTLAPFWLTSLFVGFLAATFV
jgi:hypothetical protein